MIFVGSWERTAKDDAYRTEDVVELFPDGVCTRSSKPHVANISCRFGQAVFSLFLIDLNNASLRESQKNLLTEYMIGLVEGLKKK